MNAGAEYVCYRIWGTLQDENGIHAESLLTCLGAFAGYACQMSIRQAAALPGADPTKYALTTVDADDCMTYLQSEALNAPLIDSPLSVWHLVSRIVQKLDAPLPDIQGILEYVTQTVGTSEFGIPRAPHGHHSRHLALVYLKYLWPEILPIAQRFCKRPAQIPVLFGIALQRAIEQTQGVLSPTLGASIAMESAVAMSKVVLPEVDANAAVTWPPAVAAETNTPKTNTTPKTSGTPKSLTSLARGVADSMIFRSPSAARSRTRGEAEAGTPRIGAFIARVPPATRIVTLASLAFIAIAGVMYKGDREDASPAARETRTLVTQKLVADVPAPEQFPQIAQTSQEPQPAVQQQPTASQEQRPASLEQEQPEVIAPEWPGQRTDAYAQRDAGSDGSTEIVIPADLGG